MALLDRRGFLKVGALGAAGSAVGWSFAPAHAQGPAITGEAARTARNLIFMVSDGMSFGTLTLAEIVSQRTNKRPTNWVKLFAKAGVRRCAQNTSSADSLVTDSAAAASAWGSGFKVNNAAINVTPDGTQRLPILVHARQNGKATGVVSTARVTHATPAGFYSNCADRSLEKNIAQDWLDRGIDLALGGGSEFFHSEMLAAHGELRIMRTASDLKASIAAGNAPGERDRRWLGLFSRGHVPYELDRAASLATDTPMDVPTLAEMSRAAIDRLSNSDRGKAGGFVLQIEGGRIDHAAHNNDAASLVKEQLQFDETLGAVLDFVESRDDTLLIVTTDHGNANPGLTVYNAASYRSIDRLPRATHSFDWIFEQLAGGTLDEKMDRLPGAVERATSVAMKDADRDLMHRVLKGERVMPFDGLNIPTGVLGSILANSFGVSFVSGHHTADQVELTLLGPGSERFPGEIENNDMHAIMVETLKLNAGELLPGMDTKMRVKKPSASD